ncbi:MAG: hypothetical protein K6T63_12445 [Alicyclobacillus herbarius]|uniref:hypothetical protein n=1 Tax=Alicyclobacillus herbarius TaxID=122960 RepID=UPI00041F22B6|nr:hypothetical protein [Alicyclobacillus herbarius]MCL6633427.1 hypothetical protein [Alicyclobacillus herbarius]
MTWLWAVLAFLFVACLAVCIPIQHRALNRIAFGRSVFITFALILFGLFMAVVATGLAAVIIGALLVATGYGFLILVAVKSYQRLQFRRRQGEGKVHRSADETADGIS